MIVYYVLWLGIFCDMWLSLFLWLGNRDNCCPCPTFPILRFLAFIPQKAKEAQGREPDVLPAGRERQVAAA